MPDTTFPADRVQTIQQATTDLLLEVEIQMNTVLLSKMTHHSAIRWSIWNNSVPPSPQLMGFDGRLEVSLRELNNLTLRVEALQSSPDDYIKLDFELLRIELREFQALVSQLRDSLNSSSPLFDSLYTEVTPIPKRPTSLKIKCHFWILALAVVPDPQHDPHCEPTGDFWQEQPGSDQNWVFQAAEETGGVPEGAGVPQTRYW